MADFSERGSQNVLDVGGCDLISLTDRNRSLDAGQGEFWPLFTQQGRGVGPKVEHPCRCR
jgi:hypothetical protein